MRRILLLPLVARFIETIDVCMRHMLFYVCFSDCVWVCRNVCYVAGIVEDSGVSEHWSMLYVCVSYVMDVEFFVCIMSRGAVCARVWKVCGVSSYRCCMCVSCVYPVAGHNAAFCMTCSLLMIVEDVRGDHMEEAYTRAGLITSLPYRHP